MFAFGENKLGQLGLGNQTDAVPSPTQVWIWEEILGFWGGNPWILGLLVIYSLKTHWDAEFPLSQEPFPAPAKARIGKIEFLRISGIF